MRNFVPFLSVLLYSYHFLSLIASRSVGPTLCCYRCHYCHHFYLSFVNRHWCWRRGRRWRRRHCRLVHPQHRTTSASPSLSSLQVVVVRLVSYSWSCSPLLAVSNFIPFSLSLLFWPPFFLICLSYFLSPLCRRPSLHVYVFAWQYSSTIYYFNNIRIFSQSVSFLYYYLFMTMP